MDKGFFADKKVLVMGLGRFGGGLDAAVFAHRAGARVKVTDMAAAEKLQDAIGRLESLSEVEVAFGGHDPADFESAEIVIVNPAVPPESEYVNIAREHGAVITSQIAVFLELCPARIVGITGANGKSTTTALTAHLLDHGRDPASPVYGRVWLGGNIGNRPLLTTLDQVDPADLVVLELSSFQLEQLAEVRLAPHVALLTNLTPNHLDRHGTFEDYCAAKENIFKWQRPRDELRPVSIFNGEDKIAAGWCRKYGEDEGRICIRYECNDVPDNIKRAFTLPGLANLSNLAGAMAIAKCLDVGEDRVAEALPGFRALPHRLELVREVNGVRWYNDSIATTPPSVVAALEAFERPAILIAGGYDKKLPFDELGEMIAHRAKGTILIGQTAPKIAEAIRAGLDRVGGSVTVESADSLGQAVELASRMARVGDVVLLSPACASYDMFENFQQRGEQFAALVTEIPEQL